MSTPAEALVIKEPCPECGKDMTFPETAEQIVCPHCNARFNLVAEPTAQQQAAALGAPPLPPEPPPAPPEPPVAPPPPPETPKSPPVAPPPPAAVPAAALAPSEPEDDDDEEGPPGAGDVTTPADARKRGGGRKPVILCPKPEGVTDFIHRTREFQWVAKGGLGNPYGPTSVSTVIFQIIAEAGDAGIDPVDLAIELRRRLTATGRDCRSILQRIVMVCERVCCNSGVGLMERVGTTESFRIPTKHRIEFPIPPEDMVGVKRRRELEVARHAASMLPPNASLAPQPPA